jgi:hypothetical protein
MGRKELEREISQIREDINEFYSMFDKKPWKKELKK